MLLAGSVALGACDPDIPDDEGAPAEQAPEAAVETAPADTVSIEDVLAEHTDAWMEIEGVEGTGIGLCDAVPCITIFVSRPPEEFAGSLPDTVQGHPVRLEPTGQFEAQ